MRGGPEAETGQGYDDARGGRHSTERGHSSDTTQTPVSPHCPTETVREDVPDPEATAGSAAIIIASLADSDDKGDKSLIEDVSPAPEPLSACPWENFMNRVRGLRNLAALRETLSEAVAFELSQPFASAWYPYEDWLQWLKMGTTDREYMDAPYPR